MSAVQSHPDRTLSRASASSLSTVIPYFNWGLYPWLHILRVMKAETMPLHCDLDDEIAYAFSDACCAAAGGSDDLLGHLTAQFLSSQSDSCLNFTEGVRETADGTAYVIRAPVDHDKLRGFIAIETERNRLSHGAAT